MSPITDSVDSICRDSGNKQYNKNGKLVSLYDNVPFIFECFLPAIHLVADIPTSQGFCKGDVFLEHSLDHHPGLGFLTIYGYL